jgi:hypothetical protein
MLASEETKINTSETVIEKYRKETSERISSVSDNVLQFHASSKSHPGD